MSFRKYGGIQFNAHNNYVRSKVSDAGSLNITEKIGEFNSKVICESHLDLAGSSLLNVGNIYYSDGSSPGGTGGVGPPGPPGPAGPTGPPGETGAAILANTQEFTGNNTFSAETTFLAKTKFENEVDISKGSNININGNIIMNGVSGTNGNYLQFPDGTTQNTAAATPDNVAILENNQEFSGINTFTNNNVFSGNNTLSGANNFNGANIFSNANTFSGNNTFTKANTFSGNNTFTVGNTFSGPNTFSGENSFTNANTFGGDNTFSGENSFTAKTTFKNEVDIKDSYDIKVNGNIIMNGASGTNGNYLEFPDGTQQTTAYTGSTGGVTGGVAILDASSQTFSGVNTFSNTGASGGIRVNNLMITNTTDINDEYVGNITYNSSNNNNLSIISYNDLYFNIGNSGVGGGTAFVGGYMDMSGYPISNVPLIQSVNDLNLKSGANLILTAGTTGENGAFALVAGNATLRLSLIHI